MKTVAACLVVFIHAGFPGEPGEIIKVIARSAVPFFFMISGYFCYYAPEKGKKATEKIPLKMQHILKLFLISVFFYGIWDILLKVKDGESISLWLHELVGKQQLIKFVKYNNIAQIKPHLWFLPALFYCYFLDYFIEKLHLRKPAYFCVLFLSGILLWRAEFCRIYGESYPRMEYRNYLYTGMPFYLLGQMIHEYQEKQIEKGKRLKISDKALAAGIAAGIGLGTGEYCLLGAGEIYMGNYVMVICLFLLICMCGTERKGNFLYEAMAKIGEKYAFALYLFHPAVLDAMKIWADFLKINEYTLYRWTRPLIVLGITVILIFFADFIVHIFCSLTEKCGIVISKPYGKKR